MIRAVVFDMDGILFDTERLSVNIWRECAQIMGLGDIEEGVYGVIGLNRNDSEALMKRLYGQGFPMEAFRQKTSAMIREKIERDGLPIMPGARELLQWLKENNIKTALASSTMTATVRSHLERAGFTDYFQVIIGGDLVEHSKPEPDIYLKACEFLGEDPANAAAIEDSPNGIRSSARAGMIPLMVPDLVAADDEMRSLYHAEFPNLAAVQAFLQEEAEKL